MKSFLYFLLAGSLALGACGQDPLQEMTPDASTDNADGSASGVPEGTFLVDYSVDNGSATRATGDGKLQISSLDYYVYYKAGGELLKHRRIAIDPTAQKWPMTRENMTWEQRQALQDTLQCGVDYRILFIANVDSTLFNYDGYSEANPHPAVVKGDENYSTARILLPNVPFHDNNMYCLWEGELAAFTEATTYPDQAVINRNDILLQRIVTRTDISRASDDKKTSLYNAIAKGFYEENCKGNVESAVDDCIGKFCTMIKRCAGYSAHTPYGGDENNLKVLHTNENAVNALTDLLQKDNIKDYIKAYIKESLVNSYVEIIDELYGQSQDWSTLASAQAKVIFDNAQRANSVDFDLNGYYDDTVVNDAPCVLLKDEDGENFKFRFYGFSGSGLNNFSSISVRNTSDVEFAFTSRKPFNSNQLQPNTHSNVVCDPVKCVWLVDGYPTISADLEEDENVELYDLTVILKNVEEWKNWMNTKAIDTNVDIVTVINYFFNTSCVLNHNDYFHNDKYSLSSFPFAITRPNLTEDNVSDWIELESAWEIQP